MLGLPGDLHLNQGRPEQPLRGKHGLALATNPLQIGVLDLSQVGALNEETFVSCLWNSAIPILWNFEDGGEV